MGCTSPSRVASSPWASTSRAPDRKSTRLNSSHPTISYAVFCLKKNVALHGLETRIRASKATKGKTYTGRGGTPVLRNCYDFLLMSEDIKIIEAANLFLK